jgi:hypothetical protein
MDLIFLTPLGALVAVAIVLPLAAFAYVELRARRVREALSLRGPAAASTALLGVSLALVPGLFGLAAAQPVIEKVRSVSVRSDAEIWIVMDTSRSMLARTSPSARSRFDRARSEARVVRDAVPGVPVGIASLTNRLLPHLFPTSDEATFAATLDRSIGIERPPPDQTQSSEVTTFAPLVALQQQNYFSPGDRHRVAVVFTDGETRSLPGASVMDGLAAAPRVQLFFVHVARPDERVYAANGLPEADYRPDPRSGQNLARIAAEADGKTFSENDLGGVRDAVERAIGTGPHASVATRREVFSLAPWAVLASIVPLALVLYRRNLS